MRAFSRTFGCAAPLILCACTTAPSPPLFFGELVTMGITIGTGAGTQGVDFTLGYKDQDVAVVPVGAVSHGKGQAVTAHTKDGPGAEWDALSVFGQFEGQGAQPAGDSGPGTRKVALGRFFATGLAATNLAEAYHDGWTGRPPAEAGMAPEMPSRSVSGPAKTPAGPAGGTGAEAQAEAGSSQPQPGTGGEVYVPPLVFAQTNTLGLGISTSVAEQGVQFSLGYTGRDIAFVPVMIRSADGSSERLGGRHRGRAQAPEYEDDALSVFGQFKVDTATEAVQFGLRRFFTTGMAARRLTEGFKAVIARDLQAGQGGAAGGR
ncbi:hypothetical protein [Thauera sinica]|uniref:Lipoprotein n=1 Tax=Thauera sinica TaxID=2665146 RepID=A0ABW1ASE6_9RHOO|nr:hypothetical protein [Thauera sp. K11]ATE62191.1 hypothetical protein CCZ27_21410 [Thauera sp. K11]